MYILNQSPSLWRQVLRKNFTHWEILADFLELSEADRFYLLEQSDFPLNLPLRLAEKIAKGTLEDPILKQFLPMVQEQAGKEGFQADPLQEGCRPASKLLHKYPGRALLIATSACAMHCRYCFRRHFNYDVTDKSFEDELQLISRDATIQEVILSGGDPLSLSDSTLAALFDRLAAIPHVRRVRFHTRFPIGIPERIDEAFLQLFQEDRFPVWMVLHVNHARELDKDIYDALRELRRQGVGLLSQSVLLRGVNDSVETLVELCEALIDYGIAPYYLHQLDRVQGAAHFEVPVEEGLHLMTEIAKRLPGFAVPRYVQEIPGELHKTPLRMG